MLGDEAAGDNAAGRARQHHLRWRIGRGFESHFAAIGLDDDGGRCNPGFVEAAAHHLELAADNRFEIGVGNGGGGALILLPLRQHAVGNRQGLVLQFGGENLLDLQFMGRIEVGEQQADGDRFDLRNGPDLGGDPFHLRLVEGPHHLAIGIDALVEFEAVAALDQGLGLHPAHVIVIFAVAALDERHIAVALGGHIGNDGAFPLEHGVGGNRCADAQVFDCAHIRVPRQSGDDAGDRIARRRQILPHPDRPGLGIVGDEVGEGAADIDTQDIAHSGGHGDQSFGLLASTRSRAARNLRPSSAISGSVMMSGGAITKQPASGRTTTPSCSPAS